MSRGIVRKVLKMMVKDAAGSAGLHEHPYTHAYGYQVTFERILQHRQHGIDLLAHWSDSNSGMNAADANTRKIMAEFHPGSHVQQNTLGLECALTTTELLDGPASLSSSVAAAAIPTPVEQQQQQQQQLQATVGGSTWVDRSVDAYTDHLMEQRRKTRQPLESVLGVLPERALREPVAHLFDSDAPAQLLPPGPDDPLQFMHAVPVVRRRRSPVRK